MKPAVLKPFGLICLLAISAGAGFYLYQQDSGNPRPNADAADGERPPEATQEAATPDSVIGARRPDFSLPDLEGRERHISEWDGNVLVINFWATWCPPCLKEIPEFVELQSEYGDQGLQFVGIALQDPSDVVDFARKHGMNYPNLVGELPVIRIAEAYGNNTGALPYTTVVDRQGTVVFVRQGPMRGPEVEAVIEPLL
ncbi:MAG: TlpA disulfide reductase family protein [Gammaproteobacteria bacterium]